MGTARWLGLPLSPDLGGRGLTLAETGRALHRIARRSGTTFAKLSLQPLFCSVLLDHGSPELIEREYRPLLRGARLIGNHITEATAGSDARRIQTTAHRVGADYELTGEKTQAAFAVDAQAAIVYALTESDAEGRRVSAFLVPQDCSGVSRERVGDLGERWMGRGRVRYVRVKIPAENRIGGEGRAFEYLSHELTRERALLAAIYLGVGRSAWEATVVHAGEREVFGRPLAAQEAVSFPLAEDWARLDAAELYTARALDQLDRGEKADGPAALAKWMATDVSLQCLDHSIQFHGGRGYSQELPFEQQWRDVRSGGLAHGPSEIMRLVGARSLWPRPGRSE